MRPKLFGRIVLALFALALLFVYSYYHFSLSAFSDDIGAPGETYVPWTAAEQTVKPLFNVAPGADPTEEPTPEPTAEAEPELTPEPTPEPTLDPNSPEAKALALGLPKPPDIDVNLFQYVLVNGDHPLDPPEYEPENLVYLNMTGDDTEIRTGYDGYRQAVDELIAQPLIDMTQACKDAGFPIYLSSGYRSYYIQYQNFQRVCANNGITDGKDAEGNYITMPAGCSEHQTGLCCDITDRYYEVKNDSIVDTPTVRWLAEHCAEYGFVLRFPPDKREITHVMSESWHFRYVGVEAAAYMTENNLCLEEFLALYGVE